MVTLRIKMLLGTLCSGLLFSLVGCLGWLVEPPGPLAFSGDLAGSDPGVGAPPAVEIPAAMEETEDGEEEDHCTLVPDFDFGFCCEAHDAAYGEGGGVRERLLADLGLRDCILDAGRPLLGWLYFVGVRLFGWYYFQWFPDRDRDLPAAEFLAAPM